jgi:hypothetical protein
MADAALWTCVISTAVVTCQHSFVTNIWSRVSAAWICSIVLSYAGAFKYATMHPYTVCPVQDATAPEPQHEVTPDESIISHSSCGKPPNTSPVDDDGQSNHEQHLFAYWHTITSSDILTVASFPWFTWQRTQPRFLKRISRQSHSCSSLQFGLH